MSMRDTDLHATRRSPVPQSSSRLYICYSDSHLQLVCRRHRRYIIHVFAQIHDKVPVEAFVLADRHSEAHIQCVMKYEGSAV